ncbi:MAG: hypothetical protein N3B11_06910 [Coriobacteriia bacterium]|nr:hypothetical protein [Coriobacteriia bacterium]
MSRSRALAVAVAAILVIGGIFGFRHAQKSRVRSAIVAYNAGLSDSLRTFDLSHLEGVALPREIGRVRNYLILLEATGTRLEAELLALEVVKVRSQDPTVTAIAEERWQETQRDARTGAVRVAAVRREQRVEYTLLPDEGALKVYLSRVLEDSER